MTIASQPDNGATELHSLWHEWPMVPWHCKSGGFRKIFKI